MMSLSEDQIIDRKDHDTHLVSSMRTLPSGESWCTSTGECSTAYSSALSTCPLSGRRLPMISDRVECQGGDSPLVESLDHTPQLHLLLNIRLHLCSGCGTCNCHF